MRTPIEQYVIDRVREIRNLRKMSQEALAYSLGFESKGYIGKIETYGNDDCYNVNHLNKIAEILQCSPKDFWPEQALPANE